jgi:succinate-acetate transporter protein
MLLALWGILTVFFFIASLATNLTLQLLFASLTALYFMLAGGMDNSTLNKASRGHPAYLKTHCTTYLVSSGSLLLLKAEMHLQLCQRTI